MKEEKRKVYSFDSFQVDPARRRLLREGQAVQIHSKTFDLLLALIENSGRVLDKDELLDLVWPNQVVEEGNLTVKMSALRKVLGERKDEARFIVTIPGRGYRFVADVKQAEAGGDAVVIERHAVTRIVVEEENESPAEKTLSTSEASPVRNIRPTPGLARVTEARAAKIWAITGFALFLAVAGLTAARYFGAKTRARPFESFEVRRQTNTGKVLAASVSPDGQYFAFAQDEVEGRSLWIKHVPTGGSTRIVEPQPVDYWGLTFAPDGNHVYTTTFEKSRADPVLTRIPLLGGVAQRVPVVTNAAVAFAPGGERMAYVVSSSSSGGSVLWTAHPDGSDKKFIALRKDPNYFSMQGRTVAWSPDGSTLACIVLNNTGEGFYMTVVAYAENDGKERRLTGKQWNVVSSIAWATDGGGLVLTGNDGPGLPLQVWYVSPLDGATRRITNDLNSYGDASLSSDGDTLLTVQTDATSAIWTAAANHDEMMNHFREDFSEVGDIPAVGWTPEGNLVYQSAASNGQELWLLDTDRKRTKQFTAGSLVSDFAVSPDGRYLVVVSNRSGGPNLWRLNSEDGSEPKQLTYGNGEIRPRLASNGQFVFFQKGFGDVLSSVWKVSIEGGEAHQITHSHKTFPDVSPDGKRIVYSYMDTSGGVVQWRLGVAASESGKLLSSFALPATVTNRLTRWTPDGRGLTYINTVGGASNLWLQPADGGEARQITNFGSHRIEAFDWSRDGKMIAVVRSARTSDVVLVRDSARP